MKSAIIALLLWSSAYSAESQRRISDDPGFDFSALPRQFRPLKSRVALTYHLDAVDGAPMKDRIALAKAFSGLQAYEQQAVLGHELWSLARCKEFQPVLEAMLHLPDELEQDHGDRIANAILHALIDLGSVKARELLLDDIRSGNPRLDYERLALLPEQPLPELDEVFRNHLTNKERPAQDAWKMSFAIGRYASPALLAEVKAEYSPHRGQWACAIQAAFLRYLVKHDPDYGLAELEAALLSRGQPGKNNCFGDAIYDAIRRLKGRKVEAFAIKHLAADHPQICYSASKYLFESGGVDARKELIRVVMSLPQRKLEHHGTYYPDLRERILNLFFRWWPEFLQNNPPSIAELNQLEANLSSVEKASYHDEIEKLRTIPRR